MSGTPPLTILRAYGFTPACTVQPLAGGLINQSFRVDEGARRTVLQRLHPIFAPSVHDDIEAITAHLAHKGMLTPRLVRTRAGALYTTDPDGNVWRMLTWLDGHTLHTVARPETAYAAGRLVARFHGAVSDLAHVFHFTRAGVHDTPAHLEALRRALEEHAAHASYDAVAKVADAIFAHAALLAPLPSGPLRLAHGDLKISNLLFDDVAGTEALALLDLDTMGYLTLPIELGDAFRSWCNPAGEDRAAVRFEAALFEAAVAGYGAARALTLEAAERAALVPATETIALELSARFCADALNESYFGWNPRAFETRSAHNLARAESQLALAESVRAQRAALEAQVRHHL